MKRLWIGVALLVTVLAVGIGLTVAFDRLHRPMSEQLELASAYALEEDWDKAVTLAREAKAAWEKCRCFTAAVADHEPLEEIDGLFAQLEVWEKIREPEEYAATCAQLARLAEAMADSQQVTWWSLL